MGSECLQIQLSTEAQHNALKRLVRQYGMFAIIIPACAAPILFVLYWADHKASKAGSESSTVQQATIAFLRAD